MILPFDMYSTLYFCFLAIRYFLLKVFSRVSVVRKRVFPCSFIFWIYIVKDPWKIYNALYHKESFALRSFVFVLELRFVSFQFL